MKSDTTGKRTLKPVTILGAFSLSVGAAIGWGSFVLTSTSYLSEAGPLGALLGILIGMILMGCVGYTYHYMVNRYPDSGGIHSFVFNAFGPDRAFLASWFLILVHLAILWANLTSLPLFARYLFGATFQFGFHYAIGGYDVYLGEILLAIGIIALVGGLVFLKKRTAVRIVSGMVLIFLAAILAVFIASMIKHTGGLGSFAPAFAPGDHPFSEVYGVFAMTPWAFIGFESISNSAGDFSFPHKKTFKVILASIIAVGLAYILLCFISISFFPQEYADWYAFLHADDRVGLEAIAPFYAAIQALGVAGEWIFIIALLCIVLSSLITHTIALSGLCNALAERGVLPKFFAAKNKAGNNYWVVIFIAASGSIVPFIGRVAIGWIVDVNTFGGAIVFAFTAAAAAKYARQEKQWPVFVVGLISIIASAAFAISIVIPSFYGGKGGMASETFFIFSIWGILGFLYFRSILKRDRQNRYGRSAIVWLVLMVMIIFSAIVWVLGFLRTANDELRQSIDAMNGEGTLTSAALAELFAANRVSDVIAVLILIVLTTASQIILFSVFSIMKTQAIEGQKELDLANEMATKDAMTGVRNKHAYAAKESLINQAIDRGEKIEFAVVVCDVNDLKYVNDNFGHEHGDVFIKSACEIICTTFDHSPIFRVGGDEFVAILEGDDYEHREELVGKLRALSEEHNRTQQVVISCGLATFDPAIDNAFPAIFRRADQEMYCMKQQLKATQAGKPIIA